MGAHSLEEMVAKLKKPRRVMMLVKAGKPVDDFIDKIVPLLEEGDIIIDGGNSEYQGGRTSVLKWLFWGQVSRLTNNCILKLGFLG